MTRLLIKNQQAAGLEQARTLVLLLSRQATAAEWVTFEQHAVRFRDPLNQLRRLVPVRDGVICWMNVTDYLNKQVKDVKQIVFDGEPFTATNLWRMRERVLR